MKTDLTTISKHWAIEPDVLHNVIANLDKVQAGLSLLPERNLERSLLTTIRDNIAVIHIHGVITPHLDLFTAILGGTALDCLAQELQAAVSNDDMVPVSLWFVAKACLAVPLTTGGATNPVKVLADLNIDVAANPRLTGNKVYVFRADGDVKAFIRQEEEAVQVKAKAEGSEYEFDHDAHQYGVDTWRNVGYGYWQHACSITLTKTGS